MSTWARLIYVLLEMDILKLSSHTVRDVLMLFLINVIAARSGSKLSRGVLNLELRTHSLTLTLHDLARWFIASCAWHIQLICLHGKLCSHTVGRLLFPVGKILDVTAWANLRQIPIFPRLTGSLVFANTVGRLSVICHVFW